MTLFLWPALAIAGVGAVLDIKDRRLPNWLCGVLAAASVGGLLLSGQQTLLLEALLHAAAALAVGMVLFRLDIIGGGDAKFYAAAACALPLSMALPFLGWTSLVGFLLLVGMLFGRAVFKRKSLSLKGWSVPYGVAIAGGFALALLN